MTDKEAIEALKLINLKSVHPFYHWEEMMEVRDLALSALREREERSKGCPVCDKWEDANFCPHCGRPLKGADNDTK